MTFPSLPVAALEGRGGIWAAGGGSSQGLALAVRGKLPSSATNQCTFCCYRGLEDGVGQLQGFWQWLGTGVFSGMSLRLCKGMSPWHFFSYKISPTFPICPTMGHKESCLATLQLRLTLQKYQQEILQLKIVAAVHLLAGRPAGAKEQRWPQLHPGNVCHMVHTLGPEILLSPLATLV